MTARYLLAGLAASATLCLAALPAHAGLIPYGSIGTENTVSYSFTATTTGPVSIYKADASAAYTNNFTVRVNGVDHQTGLQTFSLNGASFSVAANAGDSLVFFVTNGGQSFYSDTSLNSDSFHHIYSTYYTGGVYPASIPKGLYIGFEDLPNGGDMDYNDIQLVMTNVTGSVPEPATWAMMLIGFMGLAFATRRRSAAPRAA